MFFLLFEPPTKIAMIPPTILYPELDTIEVKVTVSQINLQFEPHPQRLVAYDTIKIDSILSANWLTSKINPALKRGNSVKHRAFCL
jgi:hypothetical protein